MTNEEWQKIRNERTAKGKAFEKYVCKQMQDRYCITITIFETRHEQYNIGESKEGYEIKYDEIANNTGRLWIEIGEKAQPRDGEYAESGIFRNDNTKYFIIGTYDIFFVFAKSELQRFVEENEEIEFIENHTKTSRGFFLYPPDAHRMAIYVIEKELPIEV